MDTPILTAKGTLSIVGLWNNKDKSVSLEKEYLAKDLPVQELKIEFINKIDDFVVNQYYINCATENGTIGYPIHYCPICGEKLK